MIRRPPTLAQNGMVVAAHPLAAEAGIAALRAGGHATDAVIAAAAVLSVVEPSASGLGGDAFFLIFDRKDNAVSAINGNGAAPNRLTPEVFSGAASIPTRGPLAATVPGAVAAWREAWYGWGRLKWEDLMQPAIALAQDGFPVSWRMARILRRETSLLQQDAGLAGLFLHEDATPLREGELCFPKALARTLARLAQEGADSFYRGAISERLCAGIKKRGGVLDPQDLAGHESSLLASIEIPLDDRIIHEQPLPSLGFLLPLVLNLLSQTEAGQPWRELHRQLQAARIALALREAFLTDPRYLPLPVGDLVDFFFARPTTAALVRLLDQEPIPPTLAFEVVLRSLEDSGAEGRSVLQSYRTAGFLDRLDRPFPASPKDPQTDSEVGQDTTYLCAMDGEGNVAGLIQSIFSPFGCGFLEPTTGIILNNRASAFSLDPGQVNRLEPGKQTMHTLNSYLIMKDGNPWIVGGTPGADQQIQTNLQILRALLLGRPLWPGPAPMVPGKWSQTRLDPSSGRQSVSEAELLAGALEAPRWSVQSDGRVLLESRFPSAVRRHLHRDGHSPARIGPWEGSGFVQVIRRLETGAYLGATDPRGEGVALGY